MWVAVRCRLPPLPAVQNLCSASTTWTLGRVSVTDPSPPFAAQLVLDAMCPNIDVSAYIDVTEFANPTDPAEMCLSVTGLTSGKGSDNPQFADSVIFKPPGTTINKCADYDTCPPDGVSGIDRGGSGDDSFTCSPGSTVPEAGEYPASPTETGQRNWPYRWTVTKFVCCLQFPPGLSEIDLRFKVSPSLDGQYGRQFLMADFSYTPCIDAPSPPPNVSPKPP
eukprot:scaffold12205_cov97-Isochrysis_galbana.AAC.1